MAEYGCILLIDDYTKVIDNTKSCSDHIFIKSKKKTVYKTLSDYSTE